MTNDFFDYELPEELIAAEPLPSRSSSRLLIIDRNAGTIKDGQFPDIASYFSEGDVLVINDTKVIKAKLSGTREKNGKAMELLFLHNLGDNRFSSLVKGASKLKQGEEILFADGTCLTFDSRRDETAIFDYSSLTIDIFSWLDKNGRMPIPPYIEKRRKELDQQVLDDQHRYQTVFADRQGSVAAPTAGLHFTQEILETLREKGVNVATVTLHVGIGTFKPVRTDDYRNHTMDAETYEMPIDTYTAILKAKQTGKKVFASGSTVTRTLETVFQENGFTSDIIPTEKLHGETALYIYGDYAFSVVDRLITNFHLPHSTLLLLTSAFTGEALLRKAYSHAIEKKYRFFSYGDATLIL